MIRPEHSYLLLAHKVFKNNGWVVERGEKCIYSGVVEVPVRLVSGFTTPWFYGQAQISDKNIIQALIGAELLALSFAAQAYDVPFSQELIDSPVDETPSEALESLSRYSIVNEMGSTVADVESRLYLSGVDMSSYNVYRDRLNAQGKRMTKEKMADYFFPEGKKSRLVIINQVIKKEPEKESPPLLNRRFRVDL